MLAALQGGCLAPIGGWACVEDGALTLRGRVLGIDGRKRLDATLTGSADDAEAIGRGVAELLLKQGAAELIRDARR